ncbi:MAG: hypothetical protein EPN48_18095 [Microbacteriaceae bacterium]|nr:MAG: hypothetical protein EPN48_18095 [Microbacteriaceae bacterium]
MSRSNSSQGRRRWRALAWIVPVLVILLAVSVLGVRLLLATEPLQHFLASYPGTSALPAAAPVGFPGWLAWQHGLNVLFLLMIVRTGWQLRTVQRPAANWTRRNTGLIRTKNPPKTIPLHLWLHLSFDTIWVLNGLIFYVLLFATGQWARIVPTSWDVFPNALSAALQYVSLNWPLDDGWTAYNALQLLTYFVTVFIAAPLAIITGIRMSPAWPVRATQVNRVYPIGLARAVHFPVMLYFVFFVIVHVTLVLSTGALRNLNHMYALRDDQSWIGFIVFAVSLVLMAAIWVAARPTVLRPIAALTGKISR